VKQTGAIALNTFRETIRDRVLAVIVLFALLMIVASLWLASISLGEEGRVMTDFGLVAVTFFGLVVAAFIAAGLIHKEVEKCTVFVLFSKPVSRAAFIAGKFIGLGVTLATVVVGMGLFLFVVAWVIDGDPRWLILAAAALIYVQLMVIVAVTIFFSTLGSAILASVLGICVFVAGQLSTNVLSLTRLGENAVTEALSWLVFALIPNFTAVDVKPAVVGEQAAAWGEVALWCGYLVAYVVAVLLLATWVFRRREF
jgi:ABC-type transport system involved in multi-copper enzyme maturation permease subunit